MLVRRLLGVLGCGPTPGANTVEIAVLEFIGVGMIVAVIAGGTMVRALVSATMRLLGRWNWWAPATLTRILPARPGP